MKEQIKKVVLAALVAAFGFAAQAGDMYWTISGVSSTTDKPMSDANPYTAYYFLYVNTSSVSESSLEQVENIVKTQNQSALDSWGSKSQNLKTVTSTDGNFTSERFYTTSYSTSALAIIINATTLADATYYMVAKVDGTGSYYVPITDISKDTTATFGSQANNVWIAIPEPTSGLLLVLGMAALALKRRRV